VLRKRGGGDRGGGAGWPVGWWGGGLVGELNVSKWHCISET